MNSQTNIGSDFELPTSSRGTSAAVAQVSAAATFLGRHYRLVLKRDVGTTAAADRGPIAMKEWMLSPHEKTCLRWIARGRTVAEIASLEGKSVADIENCLQSALVALKAKSIEEAVQKADLGRSD